MLMIPMVHAAPQFKEGVNYDVVSQTGSAQPEVMEFFLFLPALRQVRADCRGSEEEPAGRRADEEEPGGLPGP